MTATEAMVAEATDYFRDLYRAINHHDPYRWQCRLVESIVNNGQWPELLDGPTGSGKSVMLEAHVAVNAFMGSEGIAAGVPRRLVVAVNRRSLVDSQYLHAQDIARRLHLALIGEPDEGESAPDPVLARVADDLAARWGEGGVSLAKEIGPLMVTSMRGGADAGRPDTSWRSCPEAPMIICATPDMVGSRLLFRGYGVSRGMRPVEAGLLACDSVLAIDEAHLNRQLVKTARRIAEIERKATSGPVALPLQVVESTATPLKGESVGDGSRRVGVTEKDVSADEELARRVTRPKVIEVRDVGGGKSYADDIVKLALESSEARGGVTAVIVNTVKIAAAVAKGLRNHLSKLTDGGRPPVECVLGRMRPSDRDAAARRLVELGDSDQTGFIVGTQALEVGLNYDCRTMVTELCPASALVQRLGRVNRFGHNESGSAVVVDGGTASVGPYDQEDLATSRAWLDALVAAHPEGISALELSDVDVPAASGSRVLYQRLESIDVASLSNTSEHLGAEEAVQTAEGDRTDLALWLRDELGEDDSKDVSLVVRDGISGDPVAAADLLSRVPPLEGEMFPCSFSQMRGVIDRCGGDARQEMGGGAKGRALVEGARSDAGEDADARGALVLASEDGRQFHAMGSDERLIPGGVYVIDSSVETFLGPVVAPRAAKDNLDAVEDIHDEIALGEKDRGKVPFILSDMAMKSVSDGDERVLEAMRSLAGSLRESMASLLDGDSDSDLTLDQVMESFAGRVEVELPEGSLARLVMSNLEAIIPTSPFDDDGEDSGGGTPVTLVFRPEIDDSEVSRIELGGSREVALDEHEQAVSSTARAIATAVGLPATYAEVLAQAGAHHDDGKADPRFQRMLAGGRKPTSTELAKGLARSRSEVLRLYRSLGLSGWRHEQLSAAIVWDLLGDKGSNAPLPSEDASDVAGGACPDLRRLVTRLVGTSHGRGRSSFDWGVEGLCGDEKMSALHADAIGTLFGTGVWEDLVASTDRAFGYWGCAYLEALVRAADARESAREQGVQGDDGR